MSSHRHISSTVSARELFKRSKDLASLQVCNEKHIFGFSFFVSNLISGGLLTLWELVYEYIIPRFQPKTDSFQLPYQRHSSSADLRSRAVQALKRISRLSSSLHSKKNFLVGGCGVWRLATYFEPSTGSVALTGPEKLHKIRSTCYQDQQCIYYNLAYSPQAKFLTFKNKQKRASLYM